MNSIVQNPVSPPATAAMEVDLMPFVNALIDARWWLLAGALLAALASAWLAWSRPYLYQSGARVSVVDIQDPGGVSPDDRRASEVLTLVEHGFVMGSTHDNYNDVIRARLASREFTMQFLDRNNVYRHFYPGQWLADEQRWAGGFQPDRGEVFTRFRDEVRQIDRDEETDIITVSMRWPEAVQARDWANAYVRDFNAYMRQRTMEDVERKQAFLESELRRSDVLEIQQSLYRLIEAQTAIAMLASAREEYVLEIIDPAALPWRSYTMSRKKKVVIGGMAGLLLTAFVVLARVLLARMVHSIVAYRQGAAACHPSQNSKENM